MEENELKTIPGFPSYSITKDGRIWSNPRRDRRKHSRGDFWLKPRVDKKNYLYIILYANFRKYTRRIHRLVLETYVGTRPQGLQCRHLDGNPLNNNLDNLKWGTPQENINDRARVGMTACGERQGASKLTGKKVQIIRYLRKVAKFTLADLAWQFNVTQSTIGRIVNRNTWGHV